MAITATNAEIQTFPFFRLSAAILDLQLNGTIYKIADTTIKKFDPEKVEVAARIAFLSAVELEISLGAPITPIYVCKNTVAIAGLIYLL